MASLNQVNLIGNVGQDPEVRHMPSGEAVANLTLATSEKWKDKQTGEPREATEWHRVVFYGRLAEIIGQYVKKGSQLYVGGSLHTRKWQDKQTGQDRYTTEIKGSDLKILSGRPENAGGQGRDAQNGGQPQRQQQAPAQRQAPAPQRGGPSDDIPF